MKIKQFKEFLAESEAATNGVGPAIANKETPLGTKAAKRKPAEVIDDKELKESEENYNYIESRFGYITQFTIPHQEYERMKRGREKGSCWSGFVNCDNFKTKLQNTMYRKGSLMLTSDETGASVILNHDRIKRLHNMSRNDDMMLSESERFIPSEDVNIVEIGMVNESEQIDISNDEEGDEFVYNSAWDYASDVLGFPEGVSYLFANIVSAFIYLYEEGEESDEDDDEADFGDIMESAVELVIKDMVENGESWPKSIHRIAQNALDYIEDNYDL